MEAAAKAQFEFENNISLVNPARDGAYNYDAAEQKDLVNKAPWKKDPHYFKNVRISAIALLKMVTHARSGGSIEVMGLMQGRIHDSGTFIVTDAFPLPVEGTETRVNAHQQAYEFMANYAEQMREVGREENVVGWYHSHPGYGCWLSGIDVNTQMQQQQFTDPFLAVVVDPDRTISAGKVEIGAFRTYPPDYKPTAGAQEEYQTIPLDKIEDFGAHASQYYPLEIEHFKSTLDSHLLDLLWNKYWVATLSQSPLFVNRDYSNKQISDLSHKLHNIADGTSNPGRSGAYGTGKLDDKTGTLDKVVKDSSKIASEEITGLLANVVKNRIFNGVEVKENNSVDFS
ncbi:COP9 signalosome complex subunit 5 [Ascobolus immersus RN42]|uniref:COP9 signalosome complex subunit 5 n=1 Tax=Ascobolus immersus RN42 TaxID=1160509 RepID=A0A3N4HP49_ASCIM|nr:COP9 signalosome complex subunit 5 [Ascobolus immersus RN42]